MYMWFEKETPETLCADVGEIPFEESLERRRAHKWTRLFTWPLLPLLPFLLCATSIYTRQFVFRISMRE